MKERIDYIDGLRGLAIILVILYHAFARWPELVPYGGAYSEYALVKHGWLGVELFFIISGFVILLTLERSKSFSQFLFKRFIRLFPAMFICTIIIYITLPFFNERPLGEANLFSILPGLTFIEPRWWEFILGFEIKPLEGSFWTLYVEVKFYLISGLLFFAFSRNTMILTLSFLFLLQGISSYFLENTFVFFVNRLLNLFSISYFGWFSAGAAFYVYFSEKNKKFLILGFTISFISLLLIENLSLNLFFYALIIVGFFKVALLSSFVRQALSNKILLIIGSISYPLYLLHENIMISLIIKQGKIFGDLYPLSYMLLPIVFLVPLSYFIARYFEPSFRELILKFISLK
ncbi:acyltransferase [Pseudoalteromonas sp. CR1]|uniref:acyltransferase family protein n=1 Tax=Pseudoalteromonas sp. CR1 TaxID=2861964 RepID=UPI001C5E4490|nr:acyltransferase [Pseudoalteromonas sp. CR1]